LAGEKKNASFIDRPFLSFEDKGGTMKVKHNPYLLFQQKARSHYNIGLEAFGWTEELMPIGMPMRLEVLRYITIIKAETSSKSA
jgi:hypothetical protein